VQSGGWSEPYRLSSDAGKASEGFLVADQYGYVHSFWTETLFDDQRSIIQYVRFDGTTWSPTNAIYVTDVVIGNISAIVDQQGTMHVVWVEGLYGPVYYTNAPAHNALSAQNWTQPLRIDIPAGIVRFQIDSKGIFHILYANRGEEPGIYYVRSEDQGESWSEPAWLDPDILAAHTPTGINFELDETDGLHAVWMYGALDQTNGRPDWVRYTHSLDGGNTWSTPFLIDQYSDEGEHNLTAAGPKMIVQGHTVHVIWAAGGLPYRHHRFSTDAGQTWSATQPIFGELHGQAGDGLAIDGDGRVHFLGQIRYPMGIYHAFWDETQWTLPSLVYLIAQGDSEAEIGNRIHAHDLVPAVRAGNQLVLIFGDGPNEPNRRLFAMYRTLGDLSPLMSVPTPVPIFTPVPLPSVTPDQPTPTPTVRVTTPLSDTATAQPLAPVPGPNITLQVVLVPTLLLLGSTVMLQWLFKRKR
jgi:hypothetical protein